jgi:signal transduction histidine kinase
LARAFASGGWLIDRATFDLYRDMLQRWGAPAVPAEKLARTEAAIQLWSASLSGDLPAKGRRILRVEDGPILAIWSGAPGRLVLWLAAPRELETSLRTLWDPLRLRVSIYDTDGKPVFGESRAGGISLTPGETRLPFILTVASPTTGAGEGATRRALLVSGLLLAFALMLAAAYGLYRATTRELLLARQQSDFVSAVSHEFRTPLTSMRHLTELLVSRGVTSEERKFRYYELLAHETERLHRMVESLLSFGRIEGGGYAWRLEPSDAGHLVRGIVEEFRNEAYAAGRQVQCETAEDLPSIRADREALARAVWNLLENAVKYSPPGASIRVFARRERDTVLLGVEDHGAGIPAAEREAIFQKFVRGAEAKREGVRGVGIGLALVKRIVEAHGGSVRLESEQGRGSTFTLILPCPEF